MREREREKKKEEERERVCECECERERERREREKERERERREGETKRERRERDERETRERGRRRERERRRRRTGHPPKTGANVAYSCRTRPNPNDAESSYPATNRRCRWSSRHSGRPAARPTPGSKGRNCRVKREGNLSCKKGREGICRVCGRFLLDAEGMLCVSLSDDDTCAGRKIVFVCVDVFFHTGMCMRALIRVRGME